MSAVQNYLDCLQSQDNLDLGSLKQGLAAALANLGFEHFSYAHVQPPLNKRIPEVVPDGASPSRVVHEFVGNYPKDWLVHYFTCEYPDADATFQAAAGSVLPFRWDRLGSKLPLSARQRQVFVDAREFGIINGVTIPMHGPDRGLATLNFFNDLPQAEFDRIWDANQSAFLSLGAFTHESILQIIGTEPEDGEIRLTDRERECLLWTSRGKTAWEVGQILVISDETVVFHLKNAAKKMGVFSKHQAVVRAIVCGLIVP